MGEATVIVYLAILGATLTLVGAFAVLTVVFLSLRDYWHNRRPKRER